jgi:hypothetical protein
MDAKVQKPLFIDTNIWLDFYLAQSGAGLKLLNHVEAIALVTAPAASSSIAIRPT